MAEYTVFSDVSQELAAHLRERMCPFPVSSPSHIEINSPAKEGADYLLGLYLYDICREGGTAGPVFPDTGRTRLTLAPQPFALYYMVYINTASQMGLKEADFYKIIGRAAQILYEVAELVPKSLDAGDPPVYLMPTELTLEDKTKIWQSIGKPYQMSLYYRAATIYLSGGAAKEVHRVTQTDISLSSAEDMSSTEGRH